MTPLTPMDIARVDDSDLSRAAARRLGMGGLARVRVEVLHRWDRTAFAVRPIMRRR